jgi:hypothetical protein
MTRSDTTMSLSFWLALVALLNSTSARAEPAPRPAWIANVTARGCPSRNKTEVEEATYAGKRVYVVMPCDRAADTGNEHVLYSEEGLIICEFGGFAGHVTAGACDIQRIVYVRTLTPRRAG